MTPIQIPPNLLRLMSQKHKEACGLIPAQSSEPTRDTCDKSERELQDQIEQYLRSKDCWLSRSRMDKKTTTAKGVPDFIVCHRGRFIGIEVKVGDNKPTEDQEYQLAAIVKAGGQAHVVRSLVEVRDIIHAMEL